MKELIELLNKKGVDFNVLSDKEIVIPILCAPMGDDENPIDVDNLPMKTLLDKMDCVYGDFCALHIEELKNGSLAWGCFV